MEVAVDVRFGSKADMCNARRHVRFTLNSDRESGLGNPSCLLYLRKRIFGETLLVQDRAHDATDQQGASFRQKS